MEFLKNMAKLILEAFVEAAVALLVTIYLPALLDRVRAAWGVVGGRVADFGWWMRKSVPAV
jgi:hypothetical protein